MLRKWSEAGAWRQTVENRFAALGGHCIEHAATQRLRGGVDGKCQDIGDGLSGPWLPVAFLKYLLKRGPSCLKKRTAPATQSIICHSRGCK